MMPRCLAYSAKFLSIKAELDWDKVRQWKIQNQSQPNPCDHFCHPVFHCKNDSFIKIFQCLSDNMKPDNRIVA